MLCINPICRFANRFVKQKMPRLGHWVAERKGLLAALVIPGKVLIQCPLLRRTVHFLFHLLVRCANRFVKQKMPRLGHWVAERKGFEPSKRFWRLHTFQACSFDHSDTSLRVVKDSYCWVILAQRNPNSSDKDVS